MHVGNIEWLKDLDARYDLDDDRLLELGSLNINGTARSYLHAKAWVGIDQTSGDDVDIVCKATETLFWPSAFDVILSTSMLEHDPNWRESLSHNLQWLRPGGLLFLSWGAEGNLHHLPEPWASVPGADVQQWAKDAGIEVVESTWECDRYTGDCPGCYDMVLRKP